MRWMELSTTVNSDCLEQIASILGRYGHGGAAIEEWRSEISEEKTFVIKIYLPQNRSYKSIRKEIEQNLLLLSVPVPVQLKENGLKPDNWLDSLKKQFGILEIGEKFIIKPSWTLQPMPHSGKTIIELDPGAAFGTGLHPTTRLCLLRLERHLKPGMSVLDLGTGSGILAIAAAKMGAAEVLALDMDPVAVKAARVNTRINSVDDRIWVRRGTLSARVQREYRDNFDTALANINAKAISDLSRSLSKVLKSGGRLITSGVHPQGLDEVLINLALVNFTIEAIDQQGEWYLVVANKN